MKILLNLFSAAGAACLLILAASELGITAPVAVLGGPDDGEARTTAGRPAAKTPFAKPVVFNAHARSKVVQYFDTYRGEPFGLPAACAAAVKLTGVPAAWENPGIASGGVIPESERALLVEVPAELVRVLAAQSEVPVRYYLAGSRLVAVDSGGKVLDAVRIPTVRLDDERERPGTSGPLVMVRHSAK